jgi:hypothetical protein
LKTTHSAVDLQTRQSRMDQYFRQSFQDDIQSTLQILDRAHTQFVSDLGPPPDHTRPYLFDVRSLLTYNYFRILSERPEYSQLISEIVLRPIDQTDPDALAATIMTYTIAKGAQFGSDPPSSQGQAYAAYPTITSSQSPSHSPKSILKTSVSTSISTGSGDPTKPHCLRCKAFNGQIYNKHGDHTSNKCTRNITRKDKSTNPTPGPHSQAFIAQTQQPVQQQQQQQQSASHLQPQHQQQHASTPHSHHQHQQQQATNHHPLSYQQQGTSFPPHIIHYQQQQQHQNTFNHPSHQSYLAQHPIHHSLPPASEITPSYLPSPQPPSAYPSPHPYAYFTSDDPVSHPSTPSSPQSHVTFHPQTHSSFLAQQSAYAAPQASDYQVAARARALVANFASEPPSETTTALLTSLCDACD